MGRDVVLEWRTETERNNAGFAIEHRSATASEFSEVGYVEGRGTTLDPVDYDYRVTGLDPGYHRFRLRQVDFDGKSSTTPELEIVVEVPGVFVLEPAYPNPFNPATTIRFVVKQPQHVTLRLMDILGRPYEVLFEGVPSANETQAVRIDGAGLPSGIYVVRLEGDGILATQKIILMK